MRTARWASGGLVFLGTILAVASIASATVSPPFTATPSYVPYGGLADTGTGSVTATGTGSNTVGTPPAFKATTGVDKQAESSKASGSGTYAMEVYSGVQNISFVCSGPNCVTGTFVTSVEWNASWYAHVATNCPGNSSHSIILASLAMSILLSVVDQTTSTVVGSTTHPLFNHGLAAPGAATGGKASHLYILKAKTALTKGHSYTIVTYFEAYAYAKAYGGAAAACKSIAAERVGILNPTVLEWVSVS